MYSYIHGYSWSWVSRLARTDVRTRAPFKSICAHDPPPVQEMGSLSFGARSRKQFTGSTIIIVAPHQSIIFVVIRPVWFLRLRCGCGCSSFFISFHPQQQKSVVVDNQHPGTTCDEETSTSTGSTLPLMMITTGYFTSFILFVSN